MKSELIIHPRPKSTDEELCQTKLSEYSLILPSVSVGNVGQLAIDVLLTTLNFRKVAIFHHPALLPIIGHDPYTRDSKEIVTAADLHLCHESKLLVLQIRSPLDKALTCSFLSDFNEWCKKCEFQKVVVLGSCHAHLRHDSQLQGSQFRYLTNEAAGEIGQRLSSSGFTEMEEREYDDGIKKRRIPGASFLYKLLDISELPTIGLLGFVDEGDNTKDAFGLVKYVNQWLQIRKSEDSWKYPFSWKNLFGPPPPSSMY